MKVEIGAEVALFPEKEYINGIAVAVCVRMGRWVSGPQWVPGGEMKTDEGRSPALLVPSVLLASPPSSNAPRPGK